MTFLRHVSLLCATVVMTAIAFVVGMVPAQAVEGGTEVRTPTPWMASLQTTSGQFDCGATLVASRWLLTAFHCVVEQTPQTLVVRVGSLNRSQGGDVPGIETIVPYPDAKFDPSTHTISGTDLALIKLDHAVPERTLPLDRVAPQPGTSVRMLGWGSVCTATGCAFPYQLQQLSLPVASQDACANFLGTAESTVASKDGVGLCVISGAGTGVSPGDSGGPAVVNTSSGPRLAGVVHGSETANGRQLSSFTGVDSYLDWICRTLDERRT